MLTRGGKGTITFIVSVLLKYTETLPRDLPRLESKKKKKGNHTEQMLSLSKHLMIHIFPLFYSLASMEIVALISW